MSRAWRDSPTRFTEDANAEEDLRIGGYADRLFVELAQNAADAAAVAGVPGRVRVSVVDGELRVANTGAPLDDAGVAALSSLRASAKGGGVTVGRFGVGFAAVLTVSVEPRVVSRTGGVRFSEQRTSEVVAELPELAEQLQRRAHATQPDHATSPTPPLAVPVLRLTWPLDADEEPLPDGYDTEVRLPLRPGVDPEALLVEIAAEVDDLLLTLPVLEQVEVGAHTWQRRVPVEGQVEIARDAMTRRWLVHATSGEFGADEAATLGIEAAKHPDWSVIWALPLGPDDEPRPLESDVLHAPTPTDERLGLPARLIASVPMEPSRRRVRGGPAVTAVLRAAADAYVGLVRRIAPEHRLALVPGAGFPLSELDGALRELIDGALRTGRWIAPAAGDTELAGSRARVLDVNSPALVELLADVLPDLAAAPLTGHHAARTLAAVGAATVPIADAVDALAGLARPAEWWRALYDVLAQLLDAHQVTSEQLTGLGIPLIDGAVVPGARGVLLPDFDSTDLLDLVAELKVTGLRIARPDVVHPLLERFGATRADAGGLLDAPGLRAAVERALSDVEAGLEVGALITLVLRLVDAIGGGPDPERSWLGALALPAAGGDHRRADELLLPSSPLLAVLDPEAVGADGALDVMDAEFAASWSPSTLNALGVLDGFAIISDDEPAGPEHGLPEEDEWWESAETPPARLYAVRDLDLIADDAWPSALRLLAGQPDTWQALNEPGGHTAWWLSRFALLADNPPRHWRLPSCTALAGLYDEVPDLELEPRVLAAVGVRARLDLADTEDAEGLLERLADPERAPSAGVVLRAHGALAELSAAPDFDPADLEPPEAVRALDGSVIDAERAVVLDEPWLLEVADPGLLVAGSGSEVASTLAEVLDLPLGSEVFQGEVVSEGEPVEWTAQAAVQAACELLSIEVPAGAVFLHGELAVRVDGSEHKVRWWVSDGVVHAGDTVHGLARALAYVTGRWHQRHLVAELLDEPDGSTLLG